MKTKSLRKATLLAILATSLIAAISLNSCQKEIVKPKTKGKKTLTGTTNNTTSVILLQNEVNNLIFSMGGKNQKGMGQGFNFGDTSGGVIVAIDTISKPHSITYNYGAGCLGSDGKTRTGVVLVNFDNKDPRVVNNVYSISLQNYTISTPTTPSTGSNQPLSSPTDPSNLLGGNQAMANPPKVTGFNGSVSYTNTGPNTNGNLVLAETGNFVSSTGSETDTISVNYQLEWVAGVNSNPLSDLQFSITGSSVASTSVGIVDSANITSPIIKNAKWSSGCNYCIQGTVSTVVSGSSYTKFIDFGNPGGCSGQMAVTENGVTTIQNQ